MDPTDAGLKPDTLPEMIELDGYTLTPENLVVLGFGETKIKVTDAAVERVKSSRNVIDQIVEEGRVVYGVSTGFGRFAKTVITGDKVCELQDNLIRSHCAGIGKALSPEKTRRLLAVRINILCKGYSGIRLETVNKMVAAFNKSCLSYVPEKGTVGASGDLAPLSHLALGLMGEGKMWSPETGWGDAAEILKSHDLEPVSLQAKEGLALINGTQFITAIGAEALVRAKRIARQADIVAAMTLEALCGTNKAFDADVHAARPHKGQQLVARRLRSVLNSDIHPSAIAESHTTCSRVQDAYSLRCTPQVHGVTNDTIDFVNTLIQTELNSATDNPMVLSSRNVTVSAGNFHGEYPAKAMDYLAIGIHEIANISERRIERLCNPSYSDLPAFLVNNGGLNSGFMIAHCTAAALVSENKVLTHPSSVDSQSTSAATEDHVSMGGFAARKALTVVEHVEIVVAIELLAACQALDLLNESKSIKSTEPLQRVWELVRTVVKPWDKDRVFTPDIEAAVTLLRQDKVWSAVEQYVNAYEKFEADQAKTQSTN
eukprot:scpid55873/ scgid34160/ Histidine ammonia-lyase